MDQSNGRMPRAEARVTENEIRVSVNEQENEKMMEADVESFHLNFGEFSLESSLLGNSLFEEEAASKFVSPANAERLGKTSDALLAKHLIMISQFSCEAARRMLAVETQKKKYKEEKVMFERLVLALKSKLLDTTAVSELTMEELDISRAKVRLLEGARKKDEKNLQMKENRIQELELELRSKFEAAEKEKEEAVNAAHQRFIKDLAKRGTFFAAKYYTQGRKSTKIKTNEKAEVGMSVVDLDCDDDYQSDPESEQGRWGRKKNRSGPSKFSTEGQTKEAEASREEEKSPHSSWYLSENEFEEESAKKSKRRKPSSLSGEKEPSSVEIKQNEFRRLLVRIPNSEGKKTTKGKEKPSEKELRDTICKILKEVDFKTINVTDVFKQIGEKHKDVPISRKSSIHMLIEEEYDKLAGKVVEEEENGERWRER